MPLTSTGSYIAVMNEFQAHWTGVNAALGAPPGPGLKLQGGYGIADFLADRNTLEQAIIALEGLDNGRAIATAGRDAQKAALRGRLAQFRAALRAHLPNTIYPRAAPTVPRWGAVESRFLAAFDGMEILWGRINADATLAGFTPPLVIGGYALAAFSADLAAMRAAFAEVTTAENDLDLGRQQRDLLLAPARERMVQYRAAVAAQFGPAHPLTLSLPDIYRASGRPLSP